MRGRIGHVMWRRAAYWAPAVVAAALLVGGIAALWTHGLPARAGVGSRQTASATVPGSWARLADTPDPLPGTLLSLPNGKVIDPNLGTYTATANIYDPTRNTWSASSSYGDQVSGAAATLLANGHVALVGGVRACPYQLCYQTTTILYDPSSDKWTTGTASMQTHRYFPGAVTLHSGKVLMFGGANADAPIGQNYLTSAELYDSSTDTWTTVASMSNAREGATGVILPDGRVLVVGGIGPTTGAASAQQKPGSPRGCITNCPVPIEAVEVYNPSTDVWTSAGSLPDDRVGYSVTLLPTGKVLIGGGLLGYPIASTPAPTNLLYDPITNSWSQAAKMQDQRGDHVASLLPTGGVLVAGGYDGGDVFSSEIYDPSKDTWTMGPSLPTYHINATAVILQDGRVMVNGGNQGPGCCADVPATPTFRSPAPNGSGPTIEVDAFSTVPGLPTDVKATAGNNAATITWSAATPDGRPITGYTVTASPGGKSATVPGTATSATVGGLSGGASYTFTVAATNGFGAGPRSAPSNAVTPTGPSLTPTPTSPPAAPTDTPSGGTGSGPTAQTSATPTPTSAPAATDTPTPQTSTNNPPPGPPKANRSTGGSPPFLLLGLLVLVILLVGGGAVYLFARRGSST